MLLSNMTLTTVPPLTDPLGGQMRDTAKPLS
jgi:hypothetical protein